MSLKFLEHIRRVYKKAEQQLQQLQWARQKYKEYMTHTTLRVGSKNVTLDRDTIAEKKCYYHKIRHQNNFWSGYKGKIPRSTRSRIDVLPEMVQQKQCIPV